MAMELNDISSGFNISKVNDNFQKLENWVNLEAVWRKGQEGMPSYMMSPLDMNGYPILNIGVDEDNNESLLSIGIGDSRYVNSIGDSMRGPLRMGSNPLTIRQAVEGNEPVRKDTFNNYQSRASRDLQNEAKRLDDSVTKERQERRQADQQESRDREDAVRQERNSRISSDQSLQDQITGDTPTLSAERSPITWHTQVIGNSVKIPDNVNAMTVGPNLTIGEGVTIEVGENSTWSIIDGAYINDLNFDKDEGELNG